MEAALKRGNEFCTKFGNLNQGGRTKQGTHHMYTRSGNCMFLELKLPHLKGKQIVGGKHISNITQLFPGFLLSYFYCNTLVTFPEAYSLKRMH